MRARFESHDLPLFTMPKPKKKLTTSKISLENIKGTLEARAFRRKRINSEASYFECIPPSPVIKTIKPIFETPTLVLPPLSQKGFESLTFIDEDPLDSDEENEIITKSILDKKTATAEGDPLSPSSSTSRHSNKGVPSTRVRRMSFCSQVFQRQKTSSSRGNSILGFLTKKESSTSSQLSKSKITPQKKPLQAQMTPTTVDTQDSADLERGFSAVAGPSNGEFEPQQKLQSTIEESPAQSCSSPFVNQSQNPGRVNSLGPYSDQVTRRHPIIGEGSECQFSRQERVQQSQCPCEESPESCQFSQSSTVQQL